MHFFLNFKLNSSSSYVEICINLINKFFNIKKIAFLQVENEFSKALIRDFKENSLNKLRQEIICSPQLSSYLQNETSETEFIAVSQQLLEFLGPIGCEAQDQVICLKRRDYFEEERYLYFLVIMDENEIHEFTERQIGFLNIQKLLSIHLDVLYLDQTHNMFLFKNLENFSFDFFNCFFHNIDLLILQRILSFIGQENGVVFLQKKPLQNYQQQIGICYAFTEQYGLKIHKSSQLKYPNLRKLFKLLKNVTHQIISLKNYWLEHNRVYSLHSLNNQQVIFSFDEAGFLLYTNKLTKQILRMVHFNNKSNPKEIHIKELFQSQELIKQTQTVIKTLIEAKRVHSKLDSSNIQYQINFDLFSREFNGFTMAIDKNTFLNVEVNRDSLPHCNFHVFMGNRY